MCLKKNIQTATGGVQGGRRNRGCTYTLISVSEVLEANVTVLSRTCQPLLALKIVFIAYKTKLSHIVLCLQP